MVPMTEKGESRTVVATNQPLWRWLHAQSALYPFLVMQIASELAAQMLSVAIGWYVYAATHDPMSLAYVGLARFLPNIVLSLVAGQVADRLDRRKIIALSLLVQSCCMAAFSILSAQATPAVVPVYLLLLVIGTGQAFSFPAQSAMLPALVGIAEFPRAVAVSSSTFQIASLIGPAIGGVLYAWSAPLAFATAAALCLVALIAARGLAGSGTVHDVDSELVDQSILGGIRYIRANRLLLALISLDLFAVLLGGVTALLPIYAKDILAIGPAGLGALRCAPGIGAALVGFVLAHRALAHHAGRLMLLCVAGFGLATVVFALSTNFALSLAALMAAGGFDMVSMVIRQSLVQIATPDAMRGRVSAINGIFIGASSELGEFESGVTAALFGAMPAAVLGGLGTLAVVALWAKIFPELRRADRPTAMGA
jgi:MFS family permease